AGNSPDHRRQQPPSGFSLNQNGERVLPPLRLRGPGQHRCLMYVMLSEVEPKCPKCKGSFLLHDFLNRRHEERRPAAGGIRN
ncbi:unnamed protein product, partial [Linum tenue]